MKSQRKNEKINVPNNRNKNTNVYVDKRLTCVFVNTVISTVQPEPNTGTKFVENLKKENYTAWAIS
jgi:hypothetical protein